VDLIDSTDAPRMSSCRYKRARGCGRLTWL